MMISPQDAECLGDFSRWLEGLGSDARALAQLVKDAGQPEPVRVFAAGALNYLLKSADLIPAGIEDLGFIDDAFAWRTSARLAREPGGAVQADDTGLLARFAQESERVVGFLGDLAPRFERRVEAQAATEVRGRSVAALLENAGLADQLSSEVEAWANGYVAPRFNQTPYELVKLRSFFAARLSDN
jgi:uncharacterized membrane protein YkvA (DUF1232 family)